MKKWYYWLTFSLIFAVGGVVNYLDGRQIIASVLQVGLTVILAFTQLFCQRKGEKGKKVFHYICIAAILLLILLVGYLIMAWAFNL